MSEKGYIVRLSEGERKQLMDVVRGERVAARKRTAAQVLLMVDQGEGGPKWTDKEAAEAYHCHPNHVATLRRRLVERGFDSVLERKPQARPSRIRKLDEAGERELIATAQSDPPQGRVRWTLHLLGEHLVQLKVVKDSISHETVRRVLKKTIFSRIAKSRG